MLDQKTLSYNGQLVREGDRIKITLVSPYNLVIEGNVTHIGYNSLDLGGYETFHCSDFERLEVVERAPEPLFTNCERTEYFQGDIVETAEQFFMMYDPLHAPNEEEPWWCIANPHNNIQGEWWSGDRLGAPRPHKLVLDAKESRVLS